VFSYLGGKRDEKYLERTTNMDVNELGHMMSKSKNGNLMAFNGYGASKRATS